MYKRLQPNTWRPHMSRRDAGMCQDVFTGAATCASGLGRAAQAGAVKAVVVVGVGAGMLCGSVGCCCCWWYSGTGVAVVAAAVVVGVEWEWEWL